MRKSRAVGLTAVAAIVTLVAAGCSSVGGGSSSSSTAAAAPSSESEASTSAGATSGGGTSDTITVGLEQAPDGFNVQSSAANSVYTGFVDNLLESNFATILPDTTIKPNTEFGTYEKTSDDPLTVTYTFNDKAVWSDGVPIDCDDAMLAWAALSGSYPTGQNDDAGNPIDIFTPASTNGFAEVNKPTCKAGDKSFTYVYKTPYADWEALFTNSVFMPAHIAAEQGGLSSADNGAALISAIETDNVAQLTPVANFWNTGWNYQPDMPTIPDVKLLPSSGPYKIDNASNGTMTVVKNDKWWGTPGVTPTFVFKAVSPEEWVQAMANGEIDQYDPSNPNQDIVSQLKALGDKAKYQVSEGLTFSHLDFDSSPQGKLADIRVRQAFLKCIPRQELVDKFAKPVLPDAQILDLREFLPAQSNYQEILAQVPDATKYDQVDIAGAKQLLTDAGVTQPYTLKIIRSATSDLRGQQVAVIKASCDQAGFDIQDMPDPDIFTTITTRGTWDAALFGWSSSGLVASGQSIYVTGGSQNYGGYTDPTVDSSWAEVIKTVDRQKADQLKVPMEEALWSNPYNATLYATPNLAAWSSALQGPVVNPTQTGTTWNAATWTKNG
jgi:peptide/nickel transport system substrate-binding protein